MDRTSKKRSNNEVMRCFSPRRVASSFLENNNLDNNDINTYVNDDDSYTPIQRYRKHLVELNELKRKYKILKRSEPTPQSIFNYATVTVDPLLPNSRSEILNPYHENPPNKTDDVTKRIDKYLKESEKRKYISTEDRSLVEKSEVSLLVIAFPNDDSEAFLWHSIDLKQDAQRVQLNYQANFCNTIRKIFREIFSVARHKNIPLSSAVQSMNKFLQETRSLNETRRCTSKLWEHKEIKELKELLSFHPDYDLHLYLLNNVDVLLGDKYKPQINDFRINSKLCIGRVRELTITVDGVSNRFFGIDRLRGNKRSKYLDMFQKLSDMLCVIVNGTSFETLHKSFYSYTEALGTLSTPLGVNILVVDSSIFQNDVAKGIVPFPAQCIFPQDITTSFQQTIEQVFRSPLTRINFTGKFYIDFFESTTKASLFESVIKRSRDMMFNLRQDRIIDITSG